MSLHKLVKCLQNAYEGFFDVGTVLVKVKPTNGKSFPVNPVFRSYDVGAKWTDFTFSKSSKLDVSSSLVMHGMNGGIADNTDNNVAN